MDTSYDVRIWKIDIYRGSQKNTYWVRWKVGSQPPFKEPFSTSGLAESFRSRLLTAARTGEAFRLSDGLPVSMVRPAQDIDWYKFACQYVDMKWPNAAATYRRTIAESLTAVTPVLLKQGKGRPNEKAIRSVLVGWSFNPTKRELEDKPADVATTLRWIERNSLPLSAVMQPELARAVHHAAVTRLDGKAGARSVARQRRMIVNNALNHAVERNLIRTNPVKAIKWNAPKPSRAIDRRRVANPVQVRTLLRAVRQIKPSGPKLAACYASMYFAALRPEEAVNLREDNLKLPEPEWNADEQRWEHQWGDLYVEEATPHAGKAWTDNGHARDRRGLKHRERGEGRHIPCPPELTAILREHLERYGTDEEGRLFRGHRADEVPLITWNRVWKAARVATFTSRIAATPLVQRPYDLRHAAVSTWLNGGVPPTTVAEWAGHSVEVLLETYAKCLDGQDEIAKRLVQLALGHKDTAGEWR